MRRAGIPIAAGAIALGLGGAACDDNMARQAKYKAYDPAGLFEDGKVAQVPVPGTVSREEAAYRQALATPPPITAELVARGEDRFRIFCSPCHGTGGRGDGPVAGRAVPHPPDLTSRHVREAPDAHLMRVIAEGFGLMYGYGARVHPADRWAIVAFIRSLPPPRAEDGGLSGGASPAESRGR